MIEYSPCNDCCYNVLNRRCGKNHYNFYMKISDHRDCNDFKVCPYEEEEEEFTDDIPMIETCPECDNDAYWDGSNYVCENGGCCFKLD